MLYDNNRETGSQPALDPNELQPQSVENLGEFQQSTETQSGNPDTGDQVKLAPDLPSEIAQEPPVETPTPDAILEDHSALEADNEKKVAFLEHLLAEDNALLNPASEIDAATLNDMADGIQ